MKNLTVAVRTVIIVVIIYMATAMIISPTGCMKAAYGALRICSEIVIPSLFPFIFCGNMLIALGAARIMSRCFTKIMKPVFGVSGAGALALILGIVSGYPVGAACAAELYQSGECTKTEAERLLVFCNNSGPMFIIGAVGAGMLGNYRFGVLLYITHVSAALLCGMIFKKWGRDEKTNLLIAPRDINNIKTAAPDIGAAVGKSVDTILKICGFIIIFAVLTSALPKCKSSIYIYSFLEITGGLRALIQEGITGITLPLIAGFTAFSGISVLAQVLSVVIPAGLSAVPYVVGKLTQSLIAFALTYFAVILTPGAENVFAFDLSPTLMTAEPRQLLGYAIITIAMTAVAVVSMIIIIKICEHYSK